MYIPLSEAAIFFELKQALTALYIKMIAQPNREQQEYL
jgi:hypothetical protein